PIKFGDPVLDNMMTAASLDRWRLNSIIADCARITAEHLQNCEGDLEVKTFYANFGLDVIARCSFGIKLKPHSDVTNKFVIEAKRAFSRNLTLPLIAIYLFPGLIQWFNIKLLNFDIIRCFKDLAGNAIRERDKGGHKSEDYLKLLMDAREERRDTSEYPNRRETPERSCEVLHRVTTMATLFSALSEVEVLAQCVVMFLGGQDSISSLIAHIVYLLALHPDKQTKLREEVDRCFGSQGDDLSPEVVSKLDYLHAVVSEALRLFPPATRIDRSTTEDYTLGDTGITLPKGCTITVPIYAMHRDPSNFLDPDSFIPERFSEDNARTILPYTYLPFGAGPKGCLGTHLALLAVKLCLLYSLRDVEFVGTSKTK
ncbi:hypothetical protein HPB47_016091, partial [Ixodes persulcatus]